MADPNGRKGATLAKRKAPAPIPVAGITPPHSPAQEGRLDLSEMGATGLYQYSGQIFEEKLRQLVSPYVARATWAEMSNNDAIIKASLYAVDMLIRRATWRVEAAAADPESEKRAEYLETVMHDMSHSWTDHISEALTFLPFGWCLPADQLIADGDGIPRPIAAIKPGDLVLSGKGRRQKVLAVSSRPYEGEVVVLRILGYPHLIRLTPEHRLPTGRGWITANDLKQGDRLLRPRLALSEGGDYEAGWIVGLYLAEGHRDAGRTRVCFSLHRSEVPEVERRVTAWLQANDATHEFAVRRLGAEGRPLSAIMKATGREFNTCKRLLAGGASRASTAHAFYPTSEPNGGCVTASRPELRSLIDHWVAGDNARSKRLLQLPTEREFARGLVAGWLFGDGCEYRYRKPGCKNEFSAAVASTVSQALAHQMQLIAGAVGFPSPLRFSAGGQRSKLRGVEYTAPSCYHVGLTRQRTVANKWTPERAAKARELATAGVSAYEIAPQVGISPTMVYRWLANASEPKVQGLQCAVLDDFISHRIRSVSREHYRGPVHDLAVEKDRTFLAGPITVSNSFFECVFKRRSGPDPAPHAGSRFTDGLIGLRKLAIRAQDSLDRWQFDEAGGIRGMWQRPAPDFKLRYIPIEKALLYRTQMRKGNPEGVSILRGAYRTWQFKKRIEEIEAIGIERELNGLPVAWVPPQWLASDAASKDSDQLAKVQKIVRNIRTDEQMGIVMPLIFDEAGHKLIDLTLLSTNGRRAIDTSAVLNRYSRAIAMTMLADVILLGHEKVGSYGLATQKSTLFALALTAFLDSIADTLNRYLVPRLWRLNGWPLEDLAKFVHGPVEDVDLKELGAYVQQIASAGAPIFPSPDGDLERELLRVANLPVPPEDEQVEAPESATAGVEP